MKNKKKGCLIPIIGVIVVVIVLFIIALSTPTDSTDDNSTTTSEITTTEEAAKVVYEDDVIKATFIKVYDEDIVNGAVYLQLLVENKSDKEIMVATSDAAVNDMSTTIGSGVPMVIASGNSSKQPFIIFTGNTDVTKAEDITNIEFKFLLMDNSDTSIIEETEEIEINL